MRPPRTLKTIEVFASIQGEGLRQGEPEIFIRLAGCNLRCRFCDTKRSWRAGRERTIDDVVGEVERLRRHLPARWVCLTGGEPLAQDIGPLVRRLKKAGFLVHVETNGTYPPASGVDWHALSPKPPGYAFHPGFLKKADEVKLIVCRGLTLDDVRTVRMTFPRSVPVFLQPESNKAWSMAKAVDLLERAVRSGLDGIRVSVQLHKIYGIR